MARKDKIALGGGCHWCTEAVFQSLQGVDKVNQGFVSSFETSGFSEAIIVYYNPDEISMQTLIEIHLHTHKSTSNHSMREKYRSAVYTFSNSQKQDAVEIIEGFQKEFDDQLVTKVHTFKQFVPSSETFENYYQKNPNKPFCKTYINPKLKLLMNKFSNQINTHKINQNI
jgi:peptide-methionine (S)-S-oxide reductase